MPFIPNVLQTLRIMRSSIIFFTFLVILTTFSCSSSKHVSSGRTAGQDEITTEGPVEGRDGMTFETAIVVKSVKEEYGWIATNYPGSKIQGQALVNKSGRPYDVLTFETKDGETKEAHFDISKFYGKGF